jgi:hypothetical protein
MVEINFNCVGNSIIPNYAQEGPGPLQATILNLIPEPNSMHWNLSLDLRAFPSGTRVLLGISGTSDLGGKFVGHRFTKTSIFKSSRHLRIRAAPCSLRRASSQLRHSTPFLVDGSILFKAFFYDDGGLFSSQDGARIYSR